MTGVQTCALPILKAKKNGPPHIVPLAPQAVAILRDLRPLTGKGRYVFPSPLTPGRPLSDNGVFRRSAAWASARTR